MTPRAPNPGIKKSDLKTVSLARSETIPSTWYVDPAFHPFDQQTVFGTSWQFVTDLEHVARPGDVVTATIAGDPVIVVRGQDGVLRAFYNVCRHRGGPLAMKDERCDILICKYHGWTYRLDGMLRGVPHFNHVELFDKKDYGLTPVRVAVWEGLVFVHLGRKAAPIEKTFTGIAERIAPTRFGELHFVRHVDCDVHSNWKVYVDNFLEGYHVPFVHPELCSLYDYENYVTEVYDRYSVQVGPLTGERNVYTSGGGEALYYFVFPNLMLNVVPGRLQLNTVTPTAPDRCRVIFRYYYADPDAPGARERIEADITFSDQVQREDAEICERVQQGLGSRAYDRGRFSVRFEAGVYHFQQLLKQAYRAALTAA